jgi:hypothetical protein
LRLASFLAVSLGSVVLVGCPSYRVNTLPDSVPLSRAALLSAEGDFVHAASRFSFPAVVKGWRRVAMMRYDTAGLDISVGYDIGAPDCRVAVTIYVSPAPRMSFIGADPALVHSVEEKWLDAAYDRWKGEIAQVHPDAVVTSQDRKTWNASPGRKAVYAISSDRSELSVFVIDQTWFLAYRNTYPAACADEAQSRIQAFFAQWPGRVG